MPNLLQYQTSLYLRQHLDQPVDWMVWTDETLKLAKTQGKPIFLSIGYAGSHWCHVMAKESFNDPNVAALLNKHFVCIKVDREERPDLDKIYLSALQLLTQRGGGWPLNLFLDPDSLLPFFGAAYIPGKTSSHAAEPGFADLVTGLHQAFAEQREQIAEQGIKLGAMLQSLYPPALDPEMDDDELLLITGKELTERYDGAEGGFGNSIKFAMPTSLERLMRQWAGQRRAGGNDKAALDMVMTTLTRIARGGIFDHIGGGFFRYAQDRQWRVPHFEKILYDNALLLARFADGLRLGPDALFADAINTTVAWLMREMRDDRGGFYASQDGASQGMHGAHYVWRRESVKKLLDDDAYLLIETLYGLDKPANANNHWSLHRRDSYRSVIERLSLDAATADQMLALARAKMFAERSHRPEPITDKKIITAWNGLLISGLAAAGQVMQRQDWLHKAQEIADFLYEYCWNDDRLSVCWEENNPAPMGFLDDYANVLRGLVDLLQYQWRDQDAQFARAIADILVTQFYDVDQGGFFFTDGRDPKPVFRPKPTFDEALPPANATAAEALYLLGQVFSEPAYTDAAINTLRWARAPMERYPANHCALLNSVETASAKSKVVVLRGPEDQVVDWLSELRSGYKPWLKCFAVPFDTTTTPRFLPALVSTQTRSKVTAMIVEDGIVGPAFDKLTDLTAALEF